MGFYFLAAWYNLSVFVESAIDLAENLRALFFY